MQYNETLLILNLQNQLRVLEKFAETENLEGDPYFKKELQVGIKSCLQVLEELIKEPLTVR